MANLHRTVKKLTKRNSALLTVPTGLSGKPAGYTQAVAV